MKTIQLRPRPTHGTLCSVVLRHRLYEAKSIGPVQLYRRAGDGFARDGHDSPGDDEDFHTRWSCDQRAFTHGGERLKSYL